MYRFPRASPMAWHDTYRRSRPDGTLPWEKPDGPAMTAALLVTSREGGALNRNYINGAVWKPALRAADLPDTREQMMHAGRRFYASVQL